MSNWLKPFDYFFLTRPILFIPGWATLLAGYAEAQSDTHVVSSILNETFHFVWWHAGLVLGLFLFACGMGGSFVLNQLQDIDSDKNNNKLFLLGEGFVSKKSGYGESYLLLAISIIGALLLNPAFLLMILLFNVVTGYAYNFQPFVFKNKPVAGLFANMAMGWLAFAMGWTIARPVGTELILFSLPYLFFNTALYFLTTLPDIDGDRSSGKVTFPVKYGFIFTVLLCLFFFILGGAASIWLGNELMMCVLLITLPFMIRLAWQHTTAAAIVAVKIGIASFALLICLIYPWFFVVLVLIYFLTRFYYKHRFQFDYPNFKGR